MLLWHCYSGSGIEWQNNFTKFQKEITLITNRSGTEEGTASQGLRHGEAPPDNCSQRIIYIQNYFISGILLSVIAPLTD